jgi:hypothetical protein
VGWIEVRGGGQASEEKYRCHGGRCSRFQERQRAHVAEQAAMTWPMVHPWLPGMRGGLSPDCQTEQQGNKQGSPGEDNTTHHFGEDGATHEVHPDSTVTYRDA